MATPSVLAASNYGMVKEERFGHILKSLKENDRVTYGLLAKDLAVSEDTVRRDIEALHRKGLLAKVRGGAMKRSITPLAFQDRAGQYTENKNIIALKAQQLIKNGQTIFMDGGTTVCAVAAHLPQDASLRVVTNNQALVPILAGFRHIEIIVLGGYYNRDTETNVGAQTCREAANHVADLYLMGTCAIDSRFGVTAAVREDAAVKQAMMGTSLRIVSLSDRGKLSSTDHFKVCNIGEVDILVTDLVSDDPMLDPYRHLEIELV